MASGTTCLTSPTPISAGSGGRGLCGKNSAPFESTPSGNGVTLEDEMMKVAGNDMDYQAVTALYSRSIRLLKAQGKGDECDEYYTARIGLDTFLDPQGAPFGSER